MSNPYDAPQTASKMPSSLDVQHVAVRPFERLSEAKAWLGDQYWLFVGICFVGLFIGNLFALVLAGPMICGIYLCYIQREQGQAKFETLFKGFDFFLEAFIFMLLVTVATTVIIVPFYILGFVVVLGSMAAADDLAGPILLVLAPLMYLLMIVLILAISAPFTFGLPLIADRKMKALEAIKLSWAGVKANLAGIMGMYLLYCLLGFLSACACYVPLFFLLPLTFGALFMLYRDIFPIKGSI